MARKHSRSLVVSQRCLLVVGSGREWSEVVGSGRKWSGVVGSGREWPVSIPEPSRSAKDVC